MKFNNLKFANVPLYVAVAVGLFACTNIKKSAKQYDESAEYKTTPKVLELHGDSVEYEVTVTVPPKKFNKKAAVKLEPVLQYGEDASSRPPVTIQGEKAKGKSPYVINSSTGGTVTFKDKFAYDPKMKNSKLVAKGTFIIKGAEVELDQCIDLKEKHLADGIITTSSLAKSNEDILMSVDPYEPVDASVSVDIYYLINSASFNPNFRDKDAGIDNKKQLDSVSRLLKDKTFEIKGITINSFASPDGELDFNKELSDDRSKSTNNWFKGYLKKIGRWEILDSTAYNTYFFSEDWKGWKDLVQASDLSDKNEILAIMNSGKSDDDKEAEIKAKHAASYEKMKKYMLPKLRRSVIVFGTQGGLRTDDELKAVAANSLDDLTQDEELQTGKIVDDMGEKRRIFTHYTEKYPKDWRGYNNLAVVQLKTGQVEEGLKNLKKADELEPGNPFVLNNMGVAYKMKKMYLEAEEKYRSAKSKYDKNVNPDYNLGVLYLRMGKYDKANESFKATTCSYNVGLSYLMRSEYDKAEQTLNCIPADQKDGYTYYLLAVTAARKGKADGVTTNLTRAFQMDKSLKERAKDDMEFRDFKTKPEFEALFR